MVGSSANAVAHTEKMRKADIFRGSSARPMSFKMYGPVVRTSKLITLFCVCVFVKKNIPSSISHGADSAKSLAEFKLSARSVGLGLGRSDPASRLSPDFRVNGSTISS
jgi:hypothetical protein